ncbi:MAG: DUF2321 domain-containing protein [Acidimicrobiales bacterium]
MTTLVLCRHGHRQEGPTGGERFCGRCGALVFWACPACGGPLYGTLARNDSFCRYCGTVLPWAQLYDFVERLVEYIDQEPLPRDQQLIAAERLRTLTSGYHSEDERVRAGAELLQQLSPQWWQVAMPVLRSAVSREILGELDARFGGQEPPAPQIR